MRKIIFTTAIAIFVIGQAKLPAQDDTTAYQVRHAKIFPRDLIWVGETPPQPSESKALLDAIGMMKRQGVASGVREIENFIAQNPKSPWNPSLRANLATRYRSDGRYSAALLHWQEAWNTVREDKSPGGKQVADQVLGEWTGLLSSLGRLEALDQLLTENEGRSLGELTFGRLLAQARSNLKFMKENPGLSYRCGTFSLVAVAKESGIPNERLEKIKKTPSPTTGFSLFDLSTLSRESSLGLIAVKRPGSSELVVPSLVHWREGHYAAITRQKENKYLVVDPTFGEPSWLSTETINAETDGYFIVLETQKPATWITVEETEARAVFGKGWAWANPPPRPPPCTATPGKCCGPGGGGSGGFGGWRSVGASPFGGRGSGGGCSGCGGSGPSFEFTPSGSSDSPTEFVRMGMPVWRVDEPYTTLWLEDQPMSLTAGLQQEIPLRLTYNQEDSRPDNTNIFNLGPNWNMNLLSYVDILNTEGDNLFAHYNATVFGPEGGQVSYSNTRPAGGPADDYSTKGTFAVLTSGTNISGIRLTFSDGTIFTYSFIVTVIDQCDVADCNKEKRLFLTRRTDPSGNTEIELNYTTNGLGQVLLTGIKDPNESNVISFSYSAVQTAQITAISNSYSQSVSFRYDTNRMLTNITDVAGLSSSFSYLWTNSIPIVTKLTTPYGNTVFDYINPNGQLFGATTNVDRIDRAIRVRKPNGDTEVFMYRQDSSALNHTPGGTFIPSSYGDAPDVGETNLLKGLADAYMSDRNSFYWAPNQYATLSTTNLVNLTTNDYLKGRLRNWLLLSFNDPGQALVGETINMERAPSPDGVTAGQKTWYGYSGKPSTGFEPCVQGTNLYPSYVAHLLPNGESEYRYREYNILRKPTLEVATYSGDGGVARRTNTFVYSTDNLDVLLAFDRSGNLVSSNVYDSHLLTANYNTLGDATIYTLNGNRQVISIQKPSGLTTTNIYDGNGWLTMSVDLEIKRTNSYTYSNGLLSTQTDDRGLTRTFTWDALKRLTSVSYPSGTESNRYTYLDLTARKDRSTNWSYFAYDSLRRKIAETNALGRVTTFSYCSCGSPDAITDPLNNTTHFYHDYTGKRIGTVFADGTWVSNRFDSLGRITNRTDRAGTSLTNWYNHQGLLVGQSNSLGRVQTVRYDIEDQTTNVVGVDGVTLAYRFDLLGRVDRKYTDGLEEEFEYSPRGIINYLGFGERFSHYGFDPAGRKIAETNNNSEVLTFGYNSAGDLRFLTNPAGAFTEWTYDEYGRVTLKTDTGNLMFFYGYDANGRMTNRLSPEKGDAYYRYDAVGNLTNVVYPASSNLFFAYDANNRLTNMLDAVGTTRYTYTSFGALASEDGPWANDTVNYSYANQLRTMLTLQHPSASSLVATYAYDAAKRLTSISSWASSFNYLYDPTAKTHVSRISLPNGSYVTNTFDSNAQMTGTYLKNNSDVVLNSHAYLYTGGDYREVTRQTRNDGSYVDYGYDGIGQVTSALGKESGGTTNRLNEQFRYSYDNVGNLRSRTNNLFEQWFSVDSLNQLTTITRSNTLTVFGTTFSVATNVTVNGSNAVRYADNTFAQAGLTVTNSGVNVFTAVAKDGYGRNDSNTVSPLLYSLTSVEYDANGNMTFDGSSLTYEYDDENQLIAVHDSLTWRSEFVYDAKMRRRIRKEYSGPIGAWVLTNEVHYIYDGNLVIEERDALNAPVVTYTRGKDLSGNLEGAGGIGGLLARTDDRNGTTAFYHADRIGNVTMLINPQQIPVAKYLYDPFGNTLSASGPLAEPNLYRFSSKEAHAISGLIYYLYRYYALSLQRWSNRDPIEEKGGLNLYAFVGNEAVSRVDPFGHDAFPFPWPKLGPQLPPYAGNGNCYNYACNLPPSPANPFVTMFPGERAGLPDLSAINGWNCNVIAERVQQDFSNNPNVKTPPNGGKCADGYHKIRPEVANDGSGFHFKRQNPDGSWSQKMGNIGIPTPCSPNSNGYEKDTRCPDICVPD